jgi:hypothetical protein
MSMHLHHPSLSLSGHKKGRKKFRSSEQAKKHRELEQSWQSLISQHGVSDKKLKPVATKLSYVLKPPAGRTLSTGLPSLDTGHKGAVTSHQTQQYTGDRLIGIGTMHKSNLVPIFSQDEAKEISTMRRN